MDVCQPPGSGRVANIIAQIGVLSAQAWQVGELLYTCNVHYVVDHKFLKANHSHHSAGAGRLIGYIKKNE
jgi:hypothetical protein